ncbi:Glycosyltransferase [hydrothermal vent metagenome]|uniref:Glycosyltransferase n=1 Tax=hydrothermal vent metagenome TaxID=652676 RepID=A0A3B0TMK7_9ZZZZ
MNLSFSFIIPVYNRPDEISELLESLSAQTYTKPFEVVIIEDGSAKPSKEVLVDFHDRLAITYFEKPNSGPGDSRNHGMERAKGNYFIILDSDCILPPQYLTVVDTALNENYVHCYGGPDAAHESFSLVQKAINYAMTSVLTTGGIRGNKNIVGKFQPRSFNMGLSKSAFETIGGFGNIHPGEDPDLIFRLWAKGYETKLIQEAFVYHKRRINWNTFFEQVKKFGTVRPILNNWHSGTAKATYWFPTFFCMGFAVSMVFLILGIALPILMYLGYFMLVFIDSLLKNKSISIALLSLLAVCIQFIGYGYGFFKSATLLNLTGKKAQELFPNLFYKTNSVR